MADSINYKILLNSMVDHTKSYALDINNRMKNLFLYYNLGCVEEFMLNRRFKTGTWGGLTTGITLLGIPEGIFDRLINYYEVLNYKINNYNTTIQTELSSCSPLDSEVNYIKEVMSQHLENQFTLLTSEINSIVQNLRLQQKNLTDDVDKLNLVTLHSRDGSYLNRGGGRVVVFNLTGTTTLNTLKSDFEKTGTKLNDYINNYFITNFPKEYPNGEEYLLLSNQIYTNELLSFNLGSNYFKELKELISYRSGTLYEDLLKKDKNGVNGLTNKTFLKFKPKVNDIVKVWVRYDVNSMQKKVTQGIDRGLGVFNNNINNFYSDYKVEYSTITGVTAENLIRVNLRDRIEGTDDNKVNFKKLLQLYIS